MPRTETITSAANPLLKEVRKAIARGSLTAGGCAVAEGFHLLEEALGSPCQVETVLAGESAQPAVESQLRRRRGVRFAIVPDALLQATAGTETSQGVMALVKLPAWDLHQMFAGRALIVVLDGLQDPGNAGTIARTAEAFGATGMIFLKHAVSPFNPKTLRASAGSLFRLPFVTGMDAATARDALKSHTLDLYAGVPAHPNGAARRLAATDLTRPCGLIIGSESRGVSGDWRAAALDISIPTVGVESLNAAVAAAILLYEAYRQRSAHP